jgi:Uncharacterized protein involved in exopolysaccharide biosynthesis
MSEAQDYRSDEVSIFTLATTVLRNRWRIVRWLMAGAVLAAIWVVPRKPMYISSASFVLKGADAGRSGLASLAGQFGVSLPGSDQSFSPELYLTLLGSRELLGSIVRDSLVVSEMNGRRVPFYTLFDVNDPSARVREDHGIKILRALVKATVVKSTGVVEIRIATRWPSVSLSIASLVLKGINDFNRRTSQGQASAERRFIETRLSDATAELRVAEERLESFLRNNRQFEGSPELTLQRERLQRDIVFKQQIFTSLSQSFQEASIREVRDMPVTTMIESPTLPVEPEPRGRIKTVMLGGILGAMLGTLLAIVSGAATRAKQTATSESATFMRDLQQLRADFLRPVVWLRTRVRPSRQRQ